MSATLWNICSLMIFLFCAGIQIVCACALMRERPFPFYIPCTAALIILGLACADSDVSLAIGQLIVIALLYCLRKKHAR